MSGNTVLELVRSRLAASSLSGGARRLALAAMVGEAALQHALESPTNSAAETPAGNAETMARSVWLRSITVRGFRGIGPAATLTVEPGPGLTLIVGRNGSGKSSFAEGIEVALTGRNDRLAGKAADWQKQWRNIHDGTIAEVTAQFQVDGESRLLALRRSWNGASISDGVSTAAWDGSERCDVAELGWGAALEQYRPFLSYDDLGKVSEKPSVGFDLLAGVLGLETITEAQDRLTAARTELSKTIAGPLDVLPELLKDLSSVDDERARRIVRSLTSKPRQIADVRDALAEAAAPDSGDSVRALLTKLSFLPVPDVELAKTVAGDLRAAAATVEGLRGTDVEDAARLADLLNAALTHHAGHGDGPCPVCGQGTLDARWHERTAGEISRLRDRAAAAIVAQKKLGDALVRAGELIQPVPAALPDPASGGIETSATISTWREWAALAQETNAGALADGIERLAPALTVAVEAVRGEAARRLRALEDTWRPAADRVQNWLAMHARGEEAQPLAEDVGAALAWVKDQAEQLRDERLAPFRDQCGRIWANLRQESNVELGPITFAGSGRTRRKLDVPVRIDGTPGGVPMLSNGELHALGLALFLPRATALDSPFRFVVIDDPVQAMDPSKVDGLAHVLHEAAADRQVIVLTHDDRLANALRELMLPTTILEVTRREGSQVDIVLNQDPVRRYLNDARQIIRTTKLPDDLASVAAAGSCRDAIEAACQRAARRRLRASVPLSDADEQLVRARSTMDRMALALFGDSSRTGDVMRTLNQLAGARWAGDVLRDVREGAHQPRGDLERIIRDSGRLCDLITAIPAP